MDRFSKKTMQMLTNMWEMEQETRNGVSRVNDLEKRVHLKRNVTCMILA